MRPPVALALVVLLGACVSTQPSMHAPSSSASVVPSPDAFSYVYDAPGPYARQYTNNSQAWPNDLVLNCKLPVYATPSGDGFIVFPGRTFAADPRGNVAPPKEPPNGYYSFGTSYDRAFARWLPVWRTWVSPDGARYAIAYPRTAGVHIYDLASGSESVLGPGHEWFILGVESEGVYASVWAELGQGPGLWLLPFSGSPRQITATGNWFMEGGGAAYGPATVPVDPGDTIMRLDLNTGSSQPWFAARNALSVVIGFDAVGNPLVQDTFNEPNGTTAKQIWIVPAPSKGYVIANNLPYFFGEPIAADRNGIWFSGQYHVYVFVPGRGTFVASAGGGLIAGECA